MKITVGAIVLASCAITATAFSSRRAAGLTKSFNTSGAAFHRTLTQRPMSTSADFVKAEIAANDVRDLSQFRVVVSFDISRIN